MKKFLPLIFISATVLIFFWQLLLKGLLPIPSDTIVGLYYPFREAYFKTNPNGLPYKNFLITDPVRQQYPWKNLVIDAEKNITLPLWNSYNFAGTPLLANFQSGALYPMNLLFFILPFNLSWSIMIFLEPLLAAFFLYLYLDSLKLRKSASFLGAISFAFSGFFIAWLEWGTVLNTALWLPLILLSLDKIFGQAQIKKFSIWYLVFIFSLISSFFSGHLQIFFYLFIFVFFYVLTKLFSFKKRNKNLLVLPILLAIILVATFFQWFPTIKFIMLSGRNLDIVNWNYPGWFIPWQNLIQFIAPDFFGNPSTLNYYGIWNYAEFIGYIGIFPLLMAFLALFFRKDKKTFFFSAAFLLSILFALPTIFAKIPFKLDLPFISTSQPTRLLFITDFSLSVLAALGFDYFISSKNKRQVLFILGAFLFIFLFLWSFILFFHSNLISSENLKIAKQNLVLPTVLFVCSVLVIFLYIFYSRKGNVKSLSVITCLLIILTITDLFRFGWKFDSFTKKDYLFPSSSVTTFLQNQKKPFRIMSTDSKIFPPNFSIMYKLQTLDGYDPLYLQRYAELIAASGRGEPNIKAPFGFNRIITPQDPSSRIYDLLNAQYILSLNELKDTKLAQVFTDGFIRVYKNNLALQRAFFVNSTLISSSKQEAINALFDLNFPLDKRAVVENVSEKNLFQSNWDIGKIDFVDYEDNKIILNTDSMGRGFMVLTDSFYPTWHAKIDGKETKIYLTDYNFRGIIIPKGKHIIEFYISLF
jgi:uncharacterized membrane protein YfhO